MLRTPVALCAVLRGTPCGPFSPKDHPFRGCATFIAPQRSPVAVVPDAGNASYVLLARTRSCSRAVSRNSAGEWSVRSSITWMIVKL